MSLRFAIEQAVLESKLNKIHPENSDGEFRVAKNGELLLNSLRDEKFNILGLNRPNG